MAFQAKCYSKLKGVMLATKKKCIRQKKTGVTAPVYLKINKHYYWMVNFWTDVFDPEVDLMKYIPLVKPAVFNSKAVTP